MYDPRIGRWLTEDPIMFQAGDTNLDRYVGNSPTNATDPSGLQSSGYYASVNEKLAALSQFGEARSLRAANLANLALQETQNRFPAVSLHNGEGDAWRHCFWSAMMAKDPKLAPGWHQEGPPGKGNERFVWTYYAFQVGYNHEKYGDLAGQPLIEHAMDSSNNNVGLKIGRRLGPEASTDQVIAACNEALKDGRLIWINEGQLTGPGTYMEPGEPETKAMPKQALIAIFSETYYRYQYRIVTTDLSGKVVKTTEPFTINEFPK